MFTFTLPLPTPRPHISIIMTTFYSGLCYIYLVITTVGIVQEVFVLVSYYTMVRRLLWCVYE